MTVTAIVTLPQVKSYLNDTSGSTGNDVELQTYIDGLSNVVEWIAGDVRNNTYTEWHDASSPTILLRHRPALSVTSITEYGWGGSTQLLTEQSPDFGGTFDLNGFFVYYGSGVVERIVNGSRSNFGYRQNRGGFGAPDPGRVKVVYVSGLATVPANIVLATLELIGLNYQQTQQGGRPAFNRSMNDDELSGSSMMMGYLIPNRVREALAPSPVARHIDGIG